MRRDTILQHLGEEEKIKGAVVPPIFQNSLYVFDSLEEFSTVIDRYNGGDQNAYFYARHGAPNLTILEQKIAALEGVDRAKVFAGGMAAISAAIFACVETGSHVVCVDSCYGPTRRFFDEYLKRLGILTTFVEGSDTDEVIAAIRPETTLVYLESPGSLIFKMQDLEAIASYCKSKGILTMIDNSYASPLFQNPAKFGIDVVLHSATKYLAGHSDLTAGVVAGSNEFMDRLIRQEIDLIGGLIAPFTGWLLLRGMRTLSLRMKHAQEQGNTIAKWLVEQPWVEEVRHVGLDSFDQKALREKQMTGTSSLLSFIPKNQSTEWLSNFMNGLKVYQKGVSWGGFESLAVGFPYKPMDWSEARNIIRIYNGLEDPADLIEDLKQAAEKA